MRNTQSAPPSTRDSQRRLARLAAEIDRCHQGVLSSVRMSLETAIRCGELLAEAKKLCPHGEWSQWSAENFAASERTAQRYMWLFQRRDALAERLASNPPHVADLTLRSACQLLADVREAEDPTPPSSKVEKQGEHAHTHKGPQSTPADNSFTDPEDCSQEKAVPESGSGSAWDALFSAASPEWLTPPEIIDRVEAVFDGPPDVDPCSNPGEPNVPAKTHFTKRDGPHGGLDKRWPGKVFLNPHYGSRNNVECWVDASSFSGGEQ